MSEAPGLHRAAQAGAKTTIAAYPSGEEGIKKSLEEVARLIREGRHDADLRGWAADVLMKAGLDGRNHPTIKQQSQALLDAVRDATIYTPDPVGSEWIQAPHVTLCLRNYCIKGADCFPEGTLLLRSDFQLVPIEEIRVGDKIWGKDKWTKVEASVFKGKLSVDGLLLNNGSQVFLTPGHKVFVGRCKHNKGVSCPSCYPVLRKESFERVPVGDLVPGEVLLQPEKIDFGKESPDPGRMYIEGLALADGWTGDYAFNIAGKDGKRKEKQKHEVKEICDRLGIATHWHPRYITIKDSAWNDRIRRLGARARFKHLESLNLSEESAAAALKGIMADSSAHFNKLNADGSVHGLTFSTTSKMLMIQCRVLHRMFGISTSVRMLTPEQHRGAGSHPLWRVGIRSNSRGNDKALALKAIEREVAKVPCWDIQTEDHYVYLPEQDVTVSNCDDLTTALGAAMLSVGLPINLVKQSYGPQHQQHVLLGILDEAGRKLYIDPSTNKPVTTSSNAVEEIWIDPLDQVGSVGTAGAEIVTLGAPHRHGLGDLITTPIAVLQYRAFWDPFVTGTVKAIYTCASSLDPNWVAQNHPNIPFDLYVTSLNQIGDSILASWNMHAGATNAQIVQLAPEFLQDFQRVVRSILTQYQDEVRQYCPNVVFPPLPDLNLQNELVASIEGAGILAKGALEIFGIGVNGAIESYRAVYHDVTKSETQETVKYVAVAVVAASAAFLAAPLVREFVETRKHRRTKTA